MSNKPGTPRKQGRTKSRVESPFDWLRGTAKLKPGPARDVAEVADANGGWLDLDDPAIFTGTKIILSDLKLALMVLSNPKHPDNRWSCLAVQVYLGGRHYLHLLPCIPEWGKTAWETDGEPPSLGASWLSQSIIDDALPQSLEPAIQRNAPKKNLSIAEQISKTFMERYKKPKPRREF